MENPRSCKFFTSQFQARKFLLEFEEPPLLGTAQCRRIQPLYIIYRLLWAVWWLALIVYDIYEDVSNGTRWPIFATNWSLAMLTLSSVLQFACSIYHVVVRPDKKDEQKMPVLYKIDWIFYELSSPPAIGVSAMFWGFLYDGSISFTGFAAHAINTVYVLIDLCITGAPIRILHFFYSTIFFFIFVIFSLIYQLGFDQAAIYTIFDWDEAPGQAVGVGVGLFVATFVIHMLLFFLYWIKVLLCCSTNTKTGTSNIDLEMTDKY